MWIDNRPIDDGYTYMSICDVNIYIYMYVCMLNKLDANINCFAGNMSTSATNCLSDRRDKYRRR